MKFKLILLNILTLTSGTCLQAGRNKGNPNNIIIANAQPVNNRITTPNLTNKEIAEIALSLDFYLNKDPKFARHGKAVFSNGQTHITYDRNGHKGGFWKMLNNKKERVGTYDQNLTKRLGN